jgi:hypothetical protein
MEGANAVILNKAIDEMIEYYQGNEEQLGQELKWMGIISRRADILPLEDKRVIEERLSMYDDLIERDPKMRKMRAESEAKGRSKGKIEGLQQALVDVVKGRFPPLAELAQRKVPHVTKPDVLNALLIGIAAAPDESAARALLELLAA